MDCLDRSAVAPEVAEEAEEKIDEKRASERRALKVCLQRLTEMSSHLVQVEERLATLEGGTTAAIEAKVQRSVDERMLLLGTELHDKVDSRLQDVNDEMEKLAAAVASAKRLNPKSGTPPQTTPEHTPTPIASPRATPGPQPEVPPRVDDAAAAAATAAAKQRREDEEARWARHQQLAEAQDTRMQKLEAQLEELRGLAARAFTMGATQSDLADISATFTSASADPESANMPNSNLEGSPVNATKSGAMAMMSESSVKIPGASRKHQQRQQGASNPFAAMGNDFHRARAILATPMPHTLQKTMWDAAVFLESPLLPCADSIIMLLLLVGTLLAQAIFMDMMWFAFTERRFSPAFVDALQSWRVRMGHNVEFYDPFTATSLVDRVCGTGEHVVEMSSSVEAVLAAIREFTGRSTRFGGPNLVTVAVALWSARVCAELSQVWGLLRATSTLPRVATRVRSSPSAARLQLMTLSRGRKTWIYFLTFVRLCVALLLLVLGGALLTYHSITARDILLNVVILELVLDLHQAAYFFAPGDARYLIERLEPLKMPPHKSSRMCDAKACIAIIVLVVALAVLQIVALSEATSSMAIVEETICGGRRNFVYSLDALQVPHVAETSAMQRSAADGDNQGLVKAVMETIYPARRPALLQMQQGMTIDLPYNSLHEVEARTGYTVAQAASELQRLGGVACGDVMATLPSLRRYLNASVASLPGAAAVATVVACGDVKAHCLTWPLARAVCPVTCGCEDPTADLFTTGPTGGCPASCATAATAYRSRLESLPCAEPSVIDVAQLPVWQSAARQLEMQISELFKGHLEDKPCDNCTEMLLTHGCRTAEHWRQLVRLRWGQHVDPCKGIWWTGSLILKPLAIYCPITCGCTNTSLTTSAALDAHCPGTCVAPPSSS